MEKPTKTCAHCGRRIEWRRKWRDCWDEVKYCSARCRGSKGAEQGIEAVILELLSSRAKTATICPSEAARRHFGEDDWRPKMEETRMAARRLVAAEKLEVLQRGQVVDPSTARGPIRLRLPR